MMSDETELERAIELLAKLEEIDGNKAGAFTLRNHGIVGSHYCKKVAIVRAALSGEAQQKKGM